MEFPTNIHDPVLAQDVSSTEYFGVRTQNQQESREAEMEKRITRLEMQQQASWLESISHLKRKAFEAFSWLTERFARSHEREDTKNV